MKWWNPLIDDYINCFISNIRLMEFKWWINFFNCFIDITLKYILRLKRWKRVFSNNLYGSMMVTIIRQRRGSIGLWSKLNFPHFDRMKWWLIGDWSTFITWKVIIAFGIMYALQSSFEQGSQLHAFYFCTKTTYLDALYHRGFHSNRLSQCISFSES